VENRTRRLLRSRNRAQCGTERRPISESHLAASVRLRNEILFALSGLDRSPVCADLEAGSGENGDSHPRAEGPTGAVRRVRLRCGLLLSEIRGTLILLCGSHARLQNSGENSRTVREDFFRRLSLRVDTYDARALSTSRLSKRKILLYFARRQAGTFTRERGKALSHGLFPENSFLIYYERIGAKQSVVQADSADRFREPRISSKERRRVSTEKTRSAARIRDDRD